MKIFKIFSVKAVVRIILLMLFSYLNNTCSKSGCDVVYEFTAGKKLDADYVKDICKGKGGSDYEYSHYNLTTENKGSYISYKYECVACKN